MTTKEAWKLWDEYRKADRIIRSEKHNAAINFLEGYLEGINDRKPKKPKPRRPY